MDFFKSVFSADPDTADLQSGDEPVSHQAQDAPDSGGVWGFGGLIKTIASQSESVIQNYRRDLEEFGSGLRKETAAIGEAAARAVRDLPGSLEAGASVAQESLESVGRVVDDLGVTVWRGTADIISQGKEALLAMEQDAAASDSESSGFQSSAPSKRYSRFDVQVLGLQNDQNTFLEEPEDADEFEAWRKGFEFEEKDEEIDELCRENVGLEGIFEKLVPQAVEYETFWSRYFYKVHKLKLAEDARTELVKRAISAEEEEELSWEVDDDDDDAIKAVAKEEEGNLVGKGGVGMSVSDGGVGESSNVETPMEKSTEKYQVGNLAELAANMHSEGRESEGKAESEIKMENVESGNEDVMERSEDVVERSGSETILEEKGEPSEPVESCKDSEFSVVSSQPSMAEVDDLGWDEIEDLGEHDEKRTGTTDGSTNKIVLRKRLSVTEDDEDLSWDIEDD